jgi:hypothetical protein
MGDHLFLEVLPETEEYGNTDLLRSLGLLWVSTEPVSRASELGHPFPSSSLDIPRHEHQVGLHYPPPYRLAAGVHLRWASRIWEFEVCKFAARWLSTEQGSAQATGAQSRFEGIQDLASRI